MTTLRRLPHLTSIFALTAALLLSGCVSAAQAEQPADPSEIADPLEGVNRAVYGLNTAADILFIHPASVIYHEGMPEPVQDVFRNVFHNLEMPVVAINKLLQGNVEGFGTAVGRFVVNTVAGVGGVADVATDAGLPYEPTDFGVTLASWGAGQGFYVVLPLLGPSSLRDGVGRGVDWYANPIRMAADNNDLDGALMGVSAVKALDTRAALDVTISDTRRNTLDPYAAFRSLYAQHRAAEIKDQLETSR